MLRKLFGIRKHKSQPSHRQVPAKTAALTLLPPVAADGSAALRIVHAGGRIENFYMATPAKRIMEKHPSCVLARPDVFRRPWEAVVRPEEILVPGQKFFIVPRQTIKKLRRRIRKPSTTCNSFVSESSFTDVSADQAVSQLKDEFSSKSFFLQQSSDVSSISSSIGSTKSSTKGKTANDTRHVRFFGIDTKQDSDSVSMEQKKGNVEENPKGGLDSNSQPGGGKRRVRNLWEPTLTAIREIRGSEE